MPSPQGAADGRVLTWLHIGDLHMKEAGAPNHLDLQRIVAVANSLAPGSVDFMFLPGDNADNGIAAQYALVRDALAPLRLPVHVLPGDHDFEPGSLGAFYQVLDARPLPYAETIQGHRCLFLDVVSAGSGGPDFRLDEAQLTWAERETSDAEAAGHWVVIFMHTYPADLRQGAERLAALLVRPSVVCVDMGHTHYTELANDGGTIFMATRSTGQIEEGPAGFSLAAVDEGVVSWRFKPLEDPSQLVMITSPADYRLITDPASPDQVIRGRLRIAAKVWGISVTALVFAAIDSGPEFTLAWDGRSASLWQAVSNEALADGTHELAVRVVEQTGQVASERIIFVVNRNGIYEPPPRTRDGSDRDTVGAWPEKHLLGTQLGPNRNGRKW